VAFALCHVLFLGALRFSGHSAHEQGISSTLMYQLIKDGLPIMLSRLLYVLLQNIDKIMIWLLLTRRELGIYALQSYIFTIVLLLPLVVSAMLYPKMMETLGKTSKPESLRKHLIQPTLTLSYLSCLLLGVIFFGLHLPIKWLLPEYMLTITPGKILLIGAFFLVISNIATTIHISLNRQNTLISITILSILVGIVADYIMIRIDTGLAGIACGTVLSFFIFALLTITSSTGLIGISSKRRLTIIIAAIVPLIVMSFLIGGISFLIPEREFEWQADTIFTALRCILFLLTMGCLLGIVYFQRSSLLERLFEH
jgi:O-antigen/teichoic acid export membrane protein